MGIGKLRICASLCRVAIDFVDNGRFSYSSAETDGFVKIVNKNLIDTTYNLYKEGKYRTMVGPCIAHTGVIYENLSSNLNDAVTRLTSVRKPEVPGLDADLRAAQIRNLRRLHPLEGYLTEVIDTCCDDCDTFESFKSYAYSPHEKRAIRIKAYLEIIDLGMFNNGCFIKIVTGKLKLDEWAKNGKKARLVVDLTVVGSLLAGWIINKIKHRMAEMPFRHAGGVAEFVIPDPKNLQNVFTNLNTPQGVYFPYSSDDSCFSAVVDEEIRRFDVDISSCDTSHTPAIFQLLVDSAKNRPFIQDLLRLAVQQCTLPMKLKDPTRKENRILIRCLVACLFSGSTLTTLINNIANLSIFSSVMHLYRMPDFDPETDIARAAALMGYLVTVDNTHHLEQVTFLKHFGSVKDGSTAVSLALGVPFRVLGVVKGDLPGRGDIIQRTHAWNASVIKCFVHAGSNTVLDMLRQKFSGNTTGASDKYALRTLSYVLAQMLDHQKLETHHVSDDALCRRYSCTVHDIDEFRQLYQAAAPQTVTRSTFSDKVLSMDYSLGIPD